MAILNNDQIVSKQYDQLEYQSSEFVSVEDDRSQQPSESSEIEEYTNFKVFNVEGYLCQVDGYLILQLTPDQFVDILELPDTSVLFRDFSQVLEREVLEDTIDEEPSTGHRLIALTQALEFSCLGIKQRFITEVQITVTRSEFPYKFSVELVQSSIMKKFDAWWSIEPFIGPEGQKWCKACLSAAALPIGCPPWIAKVPLAGNILRQVCLTSQQRAADDIRALEALIIQGMSVDQMYQHKKKLAEQPKPASLFSKKIWSI